MESQSIQLWFNSNIVLYKTKFKVPGHALYKSLERSFASSTANRDDLLFTTTKMYSERESINHISIVSNFLRNLAMTLHEVLSLGP